MKYEEVYLRAYGSVTEARACIGRYLGFYNAKRPHQSLDRRTPDDAYFNPPTPIPAAANCGHGALVAGSARLTSQSLLWARAAAEQSPGLTERNPYACKADRIFNVGDVAKRILGRKQ